MATEDTVDLPEDVPLSTNKLRAIKDGADMPAGVLAEVMALQGAEGKISEVNTRADGVDALEVSVLTAGSTPADANVAVSTTVATLVAANPDRIKATVYNAATTGMLLVKEGAGASATSYHYALAPATATTPGGLLIVDDYKGILTGILTLGSGTARVGETTP